jgi:hypothetical protein
VDQSTVGTVSIVLGAILVVTVAFGWVYWSGFVQWLNGVRGRDWPTVSAVIDTVNVDEVRQGTGHGDMVHYVATLTYSYRNPELQTDEYTRLFSYDEQEDAHAWARSYKGSTVKVHVDPHDPSRSILRKEDL